MATIKQEKEEKEEKEKVLSIMEIKEINDSNENNENFFQKLMKIINNNDKYISYFYDFITAIITFSDLITDIMVCVYYYNKEWKIIFTISLIILIFAQLSYNFAFIVLYCQNYLISEMILIFFILIPISPIISFIFYLLNKESKFSNIISYYFPLLKIGIIKPNPNDSKLQQFVQIKIREHSGFILEAFCEAFPQVYILIKYLFIHLFIY
jgi:hypothetical protein